MIENKHSQTFLVNIEKVFFKKTPKQDDFTVFEPKHLLGVCFDRTDAIPLSQTATFNIKCLKWDLKDIPICLDLAYFQHKNITQK